MNVRRGDLVTGVGVTGTLVAADSEALGPPQLHNVWDFKISMLAAEGADVKKGEPVLAFDTTELQRRLEENTAVAEQAAKQIDKTRANVALHAQDDKLELAEAEANLRKTAMKLDAPPDILGMKERKEAELDAELAKQQLQAIKARMISVRTAAAAQIRLLRASSGAPTSSSRRRGTPSAP